MSSQQSQPSRLITEPLTELLYRSTLPVIWGTILLMGFGIVDTFYVSLLGERPLAAISFTFPVTFTLISLNIGLGIGTAATIGRLLGEGDYSRSRYYAMVAIILSFVVTGVAVLVLNVYKAEIFKLLGVKQDLWPLVNQYITPWLAAGLLLSIPMVCNSVFRANGDTKTPSKIMALGGLINVLLDPVLIFGVGDFAGYGIAGAAIATSIAWLVCSIIVLYHLIINKRWARIEGLSLVRTISATKAIVAVSLPASLANMLTPVAGALVMSVIADYGYHAVAAWGVGGRLESIIIIVILSLSMSLPPIVSQNFGAKRYDRVALAYRLAIKFTLV